MLELVKKYKKRLVQVSTDEVFGSLDKDSASEISRFNPSSPYSATKAGAELLTNSYFVTYDCDCVITRCTNNYGPRQFPEKLIPKTILLAEQDKNLIRNVYGLDTYWVIAPGGKRDCTTKVWDWRKFQKVVDYFKGKIKFIVIGKSDLLIDTQNYYLSSIFY